MDCYHDEIDFCIEKALFSINSGKYEEAEKYVRKAENLFPSQDVIELLKEIGGVIRKDIKILEEASKYKTSKRGTWPNYRNAKYSQEQLEIVRKVNKCKDYYEVLGITRQATDSEIRKAYNNLRFQLRPNKNRAPGAVEALRIVRNAFIVISGSNKAEDTRKSKTTKTETSQSDTNTEYYSQEQIEIVRKILKCKDEYEVLGITRHATDSEIKKAYKELAVLLHPDKNRAPDAARAFEIARTAFKMLLEKDTINKGKDVRKEKAAKTENSETPQTDTNTDYSQQQIEIVRKVKESKDHYEVLGITRQATECEIRKAYKNLAFQLHPDKNRAPGATEAFKILGTAFAVVSDERKRKEYDLLGKSAHFEKDRAYKNGNSKSAHFEKDRAYKNSNSKSAHFEKDRAYKNSNSHFSHHAHFRQTSTNNFEYTYHWRHRLIVAFGLILVLVGLYSVRVAYNPSSHITFSKDIIIRPLTFLLLTIIEVFYFCLRSLWEMAILFLNSFLRLSKHIIQYGILRPIMFSFLTIIRVADHCLRAMRKNAMPFLYSVARVSKPIIQNGIIRPLNFSLLTIIRFSDRCLRAVWKNAIPFLKSVAHSSKPIIQNGIMTIIGISDRCLRAAFKNVIPFLNSLARIAKTIIQKGIMMIIRASDQCLRAVFKNAIPFLNSLARIAKPIIQKGIISPFVRIICFSDECLRSLLTNGFIFLYHVAKSIIQYGISVFDKCWKIVVENTIDFLYNLATFLNSIIQYGISVPHKCLRTVVKNAIPFLYNVALIFKSIV